MSVPRMIMGCAVMAALVSFSTSAVASVSAPDISGVWSRFGAGDSQDNAAPPLKRQYLKDYQASRRRAAQEGGTSAGTLEKCRVEGMPTIMATRAPLEILQTPGQVTVLAEYMGQTRRIALDEKPPAPADINPGYMGISVGRWKDDTLEVETVGVREDVRYRGMPHGGKMRLVEKIRVTGPDELRDELVVYDMGTLTQPYHLTFHYKKQPGYRILEYPCKHPGVPEAAQAPGVKGAQQAGNRLPYCLT